MKQFISVPLLFAALLMTNSSSISTSTIDSYSEYLELEMNEVKIDGDYLTPMSVLGVTGNVLGNGYQHISDRLSAFADEYECDCYLGLWTSIENSGYASLDAIVKDWAQYYMDEDSVCILYIDESKDAHVGHSSARSVHSLHRPYESIAPVGIRPIVKRFLMVGCRNSSAS